MRVSFKPAGPSKLQRYPAAAGVSERVGETGRRREGVDTTRRCATSGTGRRMSAQRSDDWRKTTAEVRGGRARGTPGVGSRRAINHAVMACSHVHANIHVNLNRENGSPVRLASLFLSFSHARWLFYGANRRGARSKIHLYTYFSPIPPLPHIRVFGIHLAAAAAAADVPLENSPVVSQIDIVCRTKVRRREQR